MIKKIIISICLLLIAFMKAQTKIVGTYHVSSGNPDDGGYNWALLEDHSFAMFTFGQMIVGKWSIDDQNTITFTPSVPQYPFEIYGRHDAKIKGTKIMFSNFDINEDSFIGNSEQEMQPVLNPDANCLPYPLLKEFDTQFNDILLSVSSYREEKQIVYRSEVQKYNDFIIMYYPSHVRVRPFNANFKNGKLYFREEGKPSTERKDIQPDELKEIGKYISQGLSSMAKETIVSNKMYNIVSYGIGKSEEKFDEESFLKYNYHFDLLTDIYTAKQKNEVSEDDAYHDLNILYKYHRVELKPTENTYKKGEKSIFNMNKF